MKVKNSKPKYFQFLFKYSSWVTHLVLVPVMKNHVSQQQIITFSHFYSRETVPARSLIRKVRDLHGSLSHAIRKPATAAVFTGARICSFELAIALDIEFWFLPHLVLCWASNMANTMPPTKLWLQRRQAPTHQAKAKHRCSAPLHRPWFAGRGFLTTPSVLPYLLTWWLRTDR